jgi:L-aspartate oxidase
VVVIGSGAAGLSVALAASPLRVEVISKTDLTAGASRMALGGIAAAVGPADSVTQHLEDTLKVGSGASDPAVAAEIVGHGPELAERLRSLGMRFDPDPKGGLALNREAGHHAARILHAGGDATGAALMTSLRAAAERAPGVRLRSHTRAAVVLVSGGRAVGVVAQCADGSSLVVSAPAVIIATGGVGALYHATTNPPEATGDGIALAGRAGAALADLELVQFHPTALAVDARPKPLISEALRGAGAILVDDDGRRFMPGLHPDAELAPRDVITRAIWRLRQAGVGTRLDARVIGPGFPDRFPVAFAACMAHGIDPRQDRIPVEPAAHYHMGGVVADADGRTSLPGLWACGEAACTGMHGANRLASNSLLEALVVGQRCGELIQHEARPPVDLQQQPEAVAAIQEWSRRGAFGMDVRADDVLGQVRTVMSKWVGVERDAAGLEQALATLSGLLRQDLPQAQRDAVEVAWLMASSALERRESRGAHVRTDYPQTDPAWARRHVRVAPWARTVFGAPRQAA